MILSVVATPIGNIADCSPRAIAVLTQATLVLAEDTRTCKKLFSLIGVPLSGKVFLSSHAQSTYASLEKSIDACKKHEHIVLVTDAGTPAISDPGSFFIQAFRVRYPDAQIVPIPGPSAVIAALSVSGFPSSTFLFLGFIPHKKGRQTLFQTISQTTSTVVLYESPHRIMKTLEALAVTLNNRIIMVGREMTKQFEEYPVGSAQELFQYYQSHPEKIRGEFVIVVAPIDYTIVV